MDSFISTFHIDWKIIIAQAINFIVILFVLQYLALKPLKKLMKDRTDNINEGLTNAEKNKEILKNTQKEYDEIIVKARTEAHDIFQEGKREAEDKKKELLEKASLEVEQMISNGKKLLESEKSKMIEEAKGEIVSLVVAATEKLLESHDNKSFDKKAMDQIKKI